MSKFWLALACVTVSFPGLAKNKSLETFGDVAQIGIPVSAAVISLMYNDTEGLMQLTEGAIYTSAATHLLKFSIDEERPDGSDMDSFPSGHTSAAAQGAAYLQFRYGSAYGIPAYALAAVVGYSRVEARHHYWHDVAAGAALATGIQYAITKNKIAAFAFVQPYVNGDEIGIMAHMNF